MNMNRESYFLKGFYGLCAFLHGHIPTDESVVDSFFLEFGFQPSYGLHELAKYQDLHGYAIFAQVRWW
jgi:hypothetical protein